MAFKPGFRGLFELAGLTPPVPVAVDGLRSPALTSNDHFARTSEGDNTLDGLDAFGFNLTTATWTEATRQISQSGKFSSYTFVAGDRIFLSHASAFTDALFEIESKIDGSTIVMKDVIVGSDQTTVESSNGPWATIPFMNDQVAQGDNNFMCNFPGESFDINVPATQPTPRTLLIDVGGLVTWSGANIRGTVDSTMAVWDGSQVNRNPDTGAIDDNEDLVAISVENNVFKFIRIQDGVSTQTGTADAWDLRTGSAKLIFYECEVIDNNGDGWFSAGGVNDIILIGCLVDGLNSVTGIFLNNGERTWTINCVVTNSTVAIDGDNLTCVNCLAYNNSNDGIRAAHMINCTSDNNGTGIALIDTTILRSITNCLITNNTGDGIHSSSSPADSNQPTMMVNNAFFNNGSDNVDPTIISADVMERGSIIITADPYNDSANGDFSLNTDIDGGVLLKGAGIPQSYVDPSFDTTPSTDIGCSFAPLRRILAGG